MTPTAAPARFPYPHRTVAEVDRAADAPPLGKWVLALWPKMNRRRWLRSRLTRRGWQVQINECTVDFTNSRPTRWKASA